MINGQVEMIALDSLKGDYGIVMEGERFQASEENATLLEARGLAYRSRQPRIFNKMLPQFPNKSK